MVLQATASIWSFEAFPSWSLQFPLSLLFQLVLFKGVKMVNSQETAGVIRVKMLLLVDNGSLTP